MGCEVEAIGRLGEDGNQSGLLFSELSWLARNHRANHSSKFGHSRPVPSSTASFRQCHPPATLPQATLSPSAHPRGRRSSHKQGTAIPLPPHCLCPLGLWAGPLFSLLGTPLRHRPPPPAHPLGPVSYHHIAPTPIGSHPSPLIPMVPSQVVHNSNAIGACGAGSLQLVNLVLGPVFRTSPFITSRQVSSAPSSSS